MFLKEGVHKTNIFTINSHHIFLIQLLKLLLFYRFRATCDIQRFTGTIDQHSVKLNIEINFWTHSHEKILSVIPHFNQGLPVFTLHSKFGQSSQQI